MHNLLHLFKRVSTFETHIYAQMSSTQLNSATDFTDSSQTTIQIAENLPPEYHDMLLDLDQPKPTDEHLPGYTPPVAGAIVGERVVSNHDLHPLEAMSFYDPNSVHYQPNIYKSYARGLIGIRTLLALGALAGLVSNALLLTSGTGYVDVGIVAAQMAAAAFTICFCIASSVVLASPNWFFEVAIQKPVFWVVSLVCEVIAFAFFLWASFSTANGLQKWCAGMSPTQTALTLPGNWYTACAGAFLARWTSWLSAVFALLAFSFDVRLNKLARQISSSE